MDQIGIKKSQKGKRFENLSFCEGFAAHIYFKAFSAFKSFGFLFWNIFFKNIPIGTFQNPKSYNCLITVL